MGIIYACGIGSSDPRFVYEKHPDFAAFPTYPVCMYYKGDQQDLAGGLIFWIFSVPGVPRGQKAVIDAELYLEKFHELPTEGGQNKLRILGKLQAVEKKPKGALVEAGWDVTDDSGKVYYRMLNRHYHIGCDPDGYNEGGVMETPNPPAPEGPPSMVVEVPTDPVAASLFRLSGDMNPLHVSVEAANSMGYERPILHGKCTFGHTVHAVLGALAGGDQRRFKSVQARFSSPVHPGDTLQVEIWTLSPTQAIFRAVNKNTGKVSVSHGCIHLHPEAKL